MLRPVFCHYRMLPIGKQGFAPGLRASIKQDAYFRIQDSTKGVEQPPVGIDFLAVLLLQAEHHLHRREGAWSFIRGPNELLVRCNR